MENIIIFELVYLHFLKNKNDYIYVCVVSILKVLYNYFFKENWQSFCVVSVRQIKILKATKNAQTCFCT